MPQWKTVLKTTLLGGVVVILPAAVLALIARWVFDLFTGVFRPLIDYLSGRYGLYPWVADLLVIGLIVGVCFALGIVVKTRLGGWLVDTTEARLLRRVPGYSLIKETIAQVFGTGRSPFIGVALARLGGPAVTVTALVSEAHADGSFTVFVPFAPLPSSGAIYHLDGRCVELLDVTVEQAMQTVFACGAGSQKLLAAARVRPR